MGKFLWFLTGCATGLFAAVALDSWCDEDAGTVSSDTSAEENEDRECFTSAAATQAGVVQEPAPVDDEKPYVYKDITETTI